MRDVFINGKWKLRLPDERAAFFELNRHWEYERLNSMFAAIRPGDTILDIGAEHGDMTALFADWSGGDMILIEGSDKYWYWIKQIFELNGLKPPLRSYPALAGRVTNEKTRTHNGYPSHADVVSEVDPGFVHLDESPELPQIALDDLEFERLDVITIDTEGSELEIMLGARETLERHHPTVYISVHPEFLRDRYGQTPDDLHVLMSHHYGYEAFYLGYDHEQHWLYKYRGDR